MHLSSDELTRGCRSSTKLVAGDDGLAELIGKLDADEGARDVAPALLAQDGGVEARLHLVALANLPKREAVVTRLVVNEQRRGILSQRASAASRRARSRRETP